MACSVYKIPTDKRFKDILSKTGNIYRALIEYYTENPVTEVTKETVYDLLNEIRESGSDVVKAVLAESSSIVELDDKSAYRKGNSFYQRVGTILKRFSQRETKQALVDKDGKELGEQDQIATNDAIRRWRLAGVSVADNLTIDGKPYSFNEWIERKKELMEYGRKKGIAIHTYIQSELEKDPSVKQSLLDRAKAIEQELKEGLYAPDFSWAAEHHEVILRNLGINVSKDTAGYLRDKVYSEKAVANDILQMAGTIDNLTEHADGLLSIVDYKTGNGFNNKVYSKLMKYGQQEKSIYDTDLDRAKLQVMLYALMIKANHKDAKFRGLKVAHIPNRTMATSKAFNSDVEVASYLKMIEGFLQDKEELAAAGIPENAYKELLRVSPDLFNPSHYGGSNNELNRQLIEGNKSSSQLLEEKKQQLALLVAESKVSDFFTREDRDRAASLAKEIVELSADSGVKLELNAEMEVSTFNRWFGLYEDTNNPYLQVFKQIQDEAKQKKEEIYRRKKDRFNQLLQPVLDQYLSEKGKSLFKLTRGNLGTLDYNDLYSFMWKKRQVDGNVYYDFITPEEARDEGLTEDQIKLIEYVGDEFSNFFLGKDAVMNRTARIEERGDRTEKISNLDYYNKQSKFFTYTGANFAPRVPITTTEVRQRMGGILSPKYIEHSVRKHLTTFYENTFEGKDTIGVGVKYLGNMDINTSDTYTRNVELIFDKFMNNMLAKEHFDDVIALGEGLKTFLSIGENKGIYEETVKFMDDRMINDLLGQTRKDNISRKGFVLNSKGDKLDYFKAVQSMKSIVSAPIMWIKPKNGLINGMFAGMINTRKAVVGSIGEKFLGISGSVTDYTVEDMTFAHKEFMKLQMDFAKGTEKDNKLYHIIRMTRYLPDNFDTGTSEKDLISISNKGVREGAMYWFHTYFEEWNAVAVLVAQMNAMKLENGKSMYESYEMEMNQRGVLELKWKGGLRGYTQNKNGDTEPLYGLDSKEISKMRRVYQKLQGQYRKDDKHNAELYIFGQLLLQFKKFLPTLLKNMFSSKGTDLSLGYYRKKGKRENGEDIYEWVGRLNEGRWRVLTAYILNILHINKNKNYDWNSLSEEQRLGLVDSFLTISTMAMMYAGYAAAFGDTDDDDTTKKMMKRIVDNYSQMYNPGDILRTLNQPPAVMNRLFNSNKAFTDMLVASSSWVMGDEEGTYTQKGDFRGKNDFLKQVPIVTSFIELQQAFENNKYFNESDVEKR